MRPLLSLKRIVSVLFDAIAILTILSVFVAFIIIITIAMYELFPDLINWIKNIKQINPIFYVIVGMLLICWSLNRLESIQNKFKKN